jgi:molybdopterin molybdotransferase
MPRSAPAVSDLGLVSPAEVRAEVLAAITPLPPRPVALAEAGGLVLAAPLKAPFSLPPFDNAAMDGFAVRSADAAVGPATLRVIGSAYAGSPFGATVGSGEAVSIATGAMVPTGADAVVALEDAATEGDRILVIGPIERGRHVRRAGEDVPPGATVLPAGAILGPGQIAAAAAFGLSEIRVHPRPQVAILPTGDELRPPGDQLGPGQIYESVSAPLSVLTAEAGGVPTTWPVAPDDEAGLEAAIRGAAAAADVLLTVGGVSRGDRDLIGRLRRAALVRSYQVALRPARPFAFGEAAGVPLFGLPGNPAAALASFEEFVRPALRALMGRRAEVRPGVRALLAEPFRQKPGRLHLVRVEVWREAAGLRARPAGRQGAGMIHSLARAQGWAAIPPDVDVLPEGSEIDVRLLVELR